MHVDDGAVVLQLLELAIELTVLSTEDACKLPRRHGFLEQGQNEEQLPVRRVNAARAFRSPRRRLVLVGAPGTPNALLLSRELDDSGRDPAGQLEDLDCGRLMTLL